MRLLLGVGLLGGFTTFSAFSLETVRLMEHQPGLAALYAALRLCSRWRMLAGAYVGARMKTVETVEVGQDDGVARIDRWLRRRFPHLTQGQVEKLLRTGQVRVDGARVKASDRVCAGPERAHSAAARQRPRATRSGNASAERREYVRWLVIHRDNDVIVLNKPHGLAVQGGIKTPRHLDLLLEGLKFDAEKRQSSSTASTAIHRAASCSRAIPARRRSSAKHSATARPTKSTGLSWSASRVRK